MTTEPFRRPPRRSGPEPPKGELLLESPPELPEAMGGNFGQLLTLLPMVAGGGAMAFMFAGVGATPITYMASGLYGMSTVGMMVGQVGRGAGDKRRRIDGDRRDYLRYLAQVRKRVRTAATQQRDSLLWSHPEPDALWSLGMSSRLWERRPSDPDFGTVRIATGPQRAALRLISPDTKPVEDLEPITAAALRALVRAHATVPELPISVALRSYSRVSLRGDEPSARALARSIIAQLATFHSPEDLRIAVCAARSRTAEWSWVKWLPHALHPSLSDGAGPVRLVGDDLTELEELLGQDLAERPRFRPATTAAGQAHVLVVLDGGDVPPEAQLAMGDAQAVTVLDLAESIGRDTDRHLLRLSVSENDLDLLRRSDIGADSAQYVGRPDKLTVDQVEALARSLAPRRMGGEIVPVPRMEAEHDLSAILGLGDIAMFEPTDYWSHRAPRDRMRLALGLSPDGSPVELDIKESAQGGMGPHGLIIGATGSGKSELLRTIVLGLAMTHSSETLNFVLTDFKGGATFLGLEELPHTAAIITNLSEELPLVDRMQDALRGELVRRQELLRATGNYTSVFDYERARAAGAALTPLPTLLIVVDEFSELLASKPEFADLFVMIGRLGRSLAVHLLLASQRLDEGRLRGLETHLSYRICLRTFSAMESRMVLGVPDAHQLPNEPGHAYLKFDVSGMSRFRAAYVSGLYQRPSGPPAPQVLQRQIVPYTTEFIHPPAAELKLETEEPAAEVEAPTGPDATKRTMDVMVDRVRGKGPAPHRVWLPPLDEPATLDALLGPLVGHPADGLSAVAWPLLGKLCAPVGITDRPFEQRRDPLIVDLSGSAGHVAVVGAPQSGKSMLLRTLITSLALTHTPRQVQFYGLDFGGGALAALGDLPHVGSVAGRLQPDVVRRTVAELVTLLETREAAFSLHGIDSMASYRRAREEPGEHGVPVDDAYGDVFLVVDGWGTLRQEFESLEGTITTLAARGLAYGVHVVAAANRWAELRPQLRELLATRLELRLGDPFESEINRHLATNVPEGTPGRGVGKDRLHFLGALPRIDGSSTVTDAAAGIRDLVTAVRDAWHGPPAPPVRLLPLDLPHADLLATAPSGIESDGIPFGVAEDDLAPVYANFQDEPHYLVFGDTSSGKSTLLRVLADGIVRRFTPAQARVIIIDYRRTLLEAVTSKHLIGYAPSAGAAATTIKDVADAMRQRLPGPDVTPAQLRARNWWKGAELYLLVDDYDLVGSSSDTPLQPLVEILPHSRDVGLHIVLARASGGAARSVFEPVVQRLKELGTPGVVLSSGPDEGVLLGDVKGRRMPPGRGMMVRRNQPNRLVQVANFPAT